MGDGNARMAGADWGGGPRTHTWGDLSEVCVPGEWLQSLYLLELCGCIRKKHLHSRGSQWRPLEVQGGSTQLSGNQMGLGTLEEDQKDSTGGISRGHVSTVPLFS